VIRDCRLFRPWRKIRRSAFLGLMQHYLPPSDVHARHPSVCHLGSAPPTKCAIRELYPPVVKIFVSIRDRCVGKKDACIWLATNVGTIYARFREKYVLASMLLIERSIFLDRHPFPVLRIGPIQRNNYMPIRCATCDHHRRRRTRRPAGLPVIA
jgi:hypothetical protein